MPKMMKGIILAGGRGTRLYPLTKVTSKQLLPVYNKPMIYYPLQVLIDAGIKEILLITSPEQAGHFLNLLGSGAEWGVRFTYEIQDEPRGLADAFRVGENFIGEDNVTLMLGDNIFEDDLTPIIKGFESGGHVVGLEVSDPEKYGVVEFDENGKVISVQEKPKVPKSNYIIPGIYIYDSRVVQFAKEAKPSERGELEIVDMHNRYLDLGELKITTIKGAWFDTGDFESLYKAAQWARENSSKKVF